jgi:CBS domain-containing protein
MAEMAARDAPVARMEADEVGEHDDEPPVVAADTPGARSDPSEAAVMHRVVSAPVEADPLTTLTVADAMLRTPRLVPTSEPLTGIIAHLDERGRALMVVNAAGDLAGLVTRTDLQGRRPTEDGRVLTAGDVAVRRVVTARPDESLRTAARRMSRLGLRQLPVVARASARPVGMLRRSDVLEAYTRALGDDTSGAQTAVTPSSTRL